jgi:hypothetical protein
VVFDGSNIWVSNFLSDTITELRASDGATLNTFSFSGQPSNGAFDGANVWIGVNNSNTVAKM